MAWFAALLTGALCVVTFWAPGVLVARAWGMRASALGLVAAGPAVTVGVLATGAVVLEGRVPWGLTTAAAVTAVVAAAGLGLRRLARRGAPDAREAASSSSRAAGRLPALVGAAIAAGAALQLVPVAAAMRRPDAYLTAHDMSFHLAALARVRSTGNGSSLTLLSASQVDGHGASGFYGAGWHAVAALVPPWPDPAVVATVTALVPSALAWSAGLAFLTRVALPSRPRTWAWAPLLGSAGVAPPMLLVMRPEGMVPNALALALLPSVVALVVVAVRAPSFPTVAVALAGATGLALSHPNGAATTAVAAGPAVVAGVVVLLRRPQHRRVVLPGLAAVVLACVAGLVLVRGTEQFGLVTAFPAEVPLPLWEALVRLGSGNATGAGWAGGAVVMVLAVAGVVLGRRLPGRHVGYGWLALCALYLAATSPVPWLTEVDRLWYGEPRRFAPAIGTLAVPAAALALDSLWRRVRRETGRDRHLGRCALALAVGAPTLFTAAGMYVLGQATFVPAPDRTVLADAAELDMARRLATTLAPDRGILGSPFAGTANLAEVSGRRAVPPSNIPTGHDDLAYLSTHLDDLTTDPGVCAALDRLRIGYLYVDHSAWNGLDGVIDIRSAPRGGVRLVDSGGSASVYEVTAC